MKSEKLVLFYSIILALIYNFLFFNKEAGISYPIFIAFVFMFLLLYLKKLKILKKDTAWYISIFIGLLAIRPLLSKNEILNFFNKQMIIFLFVSMCLLLIKKEDYNWASLNFLNKVILTIFSPFKYFKKPYALIYKDILSKTKNNRNENLNKVLIGLAISFPILIIIIVLLASADMIFYNMLSSYPKLISSLFQNKNFLEIFIQIIIILFISTYSYSYIYELFSTKEPIHIEDNSSAPTTLKTTPIDPIIFNTVLTVINIAYLFFCIIQFKYLFNSEIRTLPYNLTFAGYARKGFWELLFISVLNFSVILFFLKKMLNKNVKSYSFINVLISAMGIFTYIMIYSSYYRMSLYQQNYGYTYLRIFVDLFLILESILLFATFIYMFIPKFDLAKVYIITSLIFYIVLNYINIDSFIAKNNVDRYFKTGKIDVTYLTGLSIDATYQTSRLLKSNNPKIKKIVKDHLLNTKMHLQQNNQWQEFNYSNYIAKKILESNQIH